MDGATRCNPHCLSIFKKTTNEYKLFLEKLNKTPQEITSETIAVIEDNYNFSYSFRKRLLHNAAGENSGSCKIFSPNCRNYPRSDIVLLWSILP
jgi:hypothetical protein